MENAKLAIKRQEPYRVLVAQISAKLLLYKTNQIKTNQEEKLLALCVSSEIWRRQNSVQIQNAGTHLDDEILKSS